MKKEDIQKLALPSLPFSSSHLIQIIGKANVSANTKSKEFLRLDGMRKKLHDEMFCYYLMHMQCSLL